MELSSARPVGMTYGPIPFEAIMAYDQLYGLSFQPWEVRAIKQLDALWLKVKNG